MKDKSKKLFDGITALSDELIEEAASPVNIKRRTWVKWTAAAASVAVLISGVLIGVFAFKGVGDSEAPAASAAYTGHDEGSVFMSYAGPVLPLNALNADDSITAKRELTFDFEPLRKYEVTDEYPDPKTGETVEYSYFTNDNASLVTDSYVLTNSSDKNITLDMLYPFCTSFSDLYKYSPKITVDGNAVEPELISGGYAGGFTGVYGNGGRDETTYNLEQPSSFLEYEELLLDGSYLDNALKEVSLADTPVVVYEVVNYRADREDKNSPNPSIGLAYTPGDEYTPISYGFHGYHGEDGKHTQVFSVPHEGMKNDGMSKCLMFIGGDPGDVEIGFYKTLDTSKTNKSEAAYGELVRYESTLLNMLERFTDEFYEFKMYENSGTEECAVSEQMYLLEVIRTLTEHGVLSRDVKDRYSSGWLMEIFNEVNTFKRVLYERFSVTVPAGSSVRIEVKMLKEASFDFDCAHTEAAGISGYDTAVSLGSSLNFTSLAANIEDRGLVEIVRDNFGFDIAKGIKHVELDTGTERYYLEVRELE